MASVDALRRRVDVLRERIGRPDGPKHWVFHVYAGQEIPECVQAQYGPHDTVFIEEIAYELRGPGDLTFDCGYVMTGQGTFIVDMPTGKLTKVKQPPDRRRRRA